MVAIIPMYYITFATCLCPLLPFLAITCPCQKWQRQVAKVMPHHWSLALDQRREFAAVFFDFMQSIRLCAP